MHLWESNFTGLVTVTSGSMVVLDATVLTLLSSLLEPNATDQPPLSLCSSLAWLFVLFLACLTISLVEGRTTTFSIEDNLELHKKLASLNKPATKTIKLVKSFLFFLWDLIFVFAIYNKR